VSDPLETPFPRDTVAKLIALAQNAWASVVVKNITGAGPRTLTMGACDHRNIPHPPIILPNLVTVG